MTNSINRISFNDNLYELLDSAYSDFNKKIRDELYSFNQQHSQEVDEENKAEPHTRHTSSNSIEYSAGKVIYYYNKLAHNELLKLLDLPYESQDQILTASLFDYRDQIVSIQTLAQQTFKSTVEMIKSLQIDLQESLADLQATIDETRVEDYFGNDIFFNEEVKPCEFEALDSSKKLLGKRKNRPSDFELNIQTSTYRFIREVRDITKSNIDMYFLKSYRGFEEKSGIIESVVNVLSHSKLIAHKITNQKMTEFIDCTLCEDLLYKPMSFIKCGHTFCASCLDSVYREHAKKLSQKKGSIVLCPTCKQVAVNKPYPNIIMAQLVDKYINESTTTAEQKESYFKRIATIDRLDIEKAQRFKQKEKDLKDKGVVFNNISTPWDNTNSRKFIVGMKSYWRPSPLQVAYFESVGLTKERIAAATNQEVAIMLNNLRIEVPRWITPSIDDVRYDFVMAKDILNLIVDGG